MENILRIKKEYNTLDKLHYFLKNESSFECSKEYDIWEMRTDVNGQMEQCVVIKKSAMHAVKLFLLNENQAKINHIIPNKMMNAYFGKSVKARRNIIQLVTGKITEAVLANPQKKAFEELEQIVKRIAI